MTRWFATLCLPTTMCSGLAVIGFASAVDSQVATNPLIPPGELSGLPFRAGIAAGQFFRPGFPGA